MPEPLSPSEIRASLIKYAAFCLNRRPYFTESIRHKLVLRAKKLKFRESSGVISDILKDLKKAGYLDDLYLAQAFTRRQLEKCYGPRIINLKLHHLHLDKVTAEQALEEATTERQLESIKKYTSKYRSSDKYKVISKLYSRGFNSSIINKVFDAEYIED